MGPDGMGTGAVSWRLSVCVCVGGDSGLTDPGYSTDLSLRDPVAKGS